MIALTKKQDTGATSQQPPIKKIYCTWQIENGPDPYPYSKGPRNSKHRRIHSCFYTSAHETTFVLSICPALQQHLPIAYPASSLNLIVCIITARILDSEGILCNKMQSQEAGSMWSWHWCTNCCRDELCRRLILSMNSWCAVQAKTCCYILRPEQWVFHCNHPA